MDQIQITSVQLLLWIRSAAAVGFSVFPFPPSEKPGEANPAHFSTAGSIAGIRSDCTERAQTSAGILHRLSAARNVIPRRDVSERPSENHVLTFPTLRLSFISNLCKLNQSRNRFWKIPFLFERRKKSNKSKDSTFKRNVLLASCWMLEYRQGQYSVHGCRQIPVYFYEEE